MENRRSKPRNFTRDVVVVAFAFSVLLIGIVAYLASQVKRDISERYIYDATQRAGEKFSAMQGSIDGWLGMICDWGESGVASLSKPDDLKKLLGPIFREERLLSGITIADAEGRSYFILPDGTERKPSESEGFDPRERPWYVPALETDGVYWTEQYRFHTLQQVGITASAAYSSPEGKGRSVVALDILLPDLYRDIKGMAESPNSEVFVFRGNELLFLPEYGSASSGFVPIGSITNELIHSDALWEKGRASENEVFSFLYEGKVWWCGFQPLGDNRGKVSMGVVVPESDIVGDISRRRTFFLGFGFASILLSVGLAFWLSHRYGRSFSASTFDADSNGESVRALIAKGENRHVEFKSTLRMNLHSKKPGKEIELAWLKGIAAFLNTDGGTLLLGVTDAGEIAGLEQDVFENEDKCRLHFKNLIAAHIGAELSKYIRFVLVPVEGKTVGIVHCSRSAEPVFLKNGNKEAFYIRNGPSSDELPVSKALKYIKQRK